MNLFQKGKYLTLIAIIILSLALRFFELDKFPIGFHRDEAYLGYNAYSILKTGKDISGNFLPLHIESFLFSPAGYAYFSIPFIALFDLTHFSVRAASAFFGVLSIALLFFITKNFFRKNKYKEEIAMLSSFLLAITPWHIILTRTATENSIVVFLLLISIYLFQIFNKSEKKIYLIFAFFVMAYTYLVYQAPRAFVPLIVPATILLIKKGIFSKIKYLFVLLYIVLILLPIFIILNSENLNTRIRTLSIFNNVESNLTLTEQVTRDGVAGLPYAATRLFHNKPVYYSSVFLENYFSHFSYAFWFTENYLPERYVVPKHGILYVFQLPLILFGLYKILKNERNVGLFILFWILLSPIGSSLTFDDTQNIQRTFFAVPAFAILSSYGAVSFFNLIKSKFIKRIFIIFISGVTFYSFMFFLVQYFFQAPFYKTWLRQDGYYSLVSSVNENKNEYSKIVITNRESAPTIYFLFYEKYDPLKFQQIVKSSELKDTDRIGYENYEFTVEECPLRIQSDDKTGNNIISGEKNVLYVNSGLCKLDELPENIKVIEEIRRNDGSTAFYLMEIE